MTHYFVYFWALCVTLSFFGWGALFLFTLRLSRLPLPVFGAAGVFLFTTAAGVLNLLHLVTPVVLKTIVLCGTGLAVLALGFRVSRLSGWMAGSLKAIRRRPLASLITATAGVIVLVIALANADRKLFLESDDFGAYLTYPKKTFSLGTVPAEPFSERRIVSSAGENYVLEALMLPGGSLRSVAFVDVGFGYILLILTAYQLFRVYGVSGSIAGLLSALVILLPFVRNNLQMQILPCALFLSVALIERTVTGWRFAVLFGLAVAAISGMKQSYLPVAVLLLVCFFWFRRLFAGLRNAFSLLAVTLVSGVVAMLPWMVDSYRKEGTYFYPLLGSGYHASAYGFVPTFSRGGVPLLTILAIIPLAVPLVLLLAPVYVRYRERVRGLEMCLALLASAAVGVVIAGYATSGDSVGRYTLPFIDAALLVLLAVHFRSRFPTWTKTVFAGWCGFLIFYYGFYHSGVTYEIKEIRSALVSNDIHLDFDQRLLDDVLLRKYES
jgi:hypothetical protein